jgi:hypothetical protein
MMLRFYIARNQLSIPTFALESLSLGAFSKTRNCCKRVKREVQLTF